MTNESSLSQLFAFLQDQPVVRTVPKGNDLWFVLKDVLREIKTTTNTTQAAEAIHRHLGDGFVEEKPVKDTLGCIRKTLVIHEAAVTLIISRSNTEIGRKLNRHLFLEVLPSLRAAGRFEAQNLKVRPNPPNYTTKTHIASLERLLASSNPKTPEVTRV